MVALVAVLSACDTTPRAHGVGEMAYETVAFDSIFRPVSRTRLVEDPDHVIGSATSGDIDGDGNVYIADKPQREVKVWSRSGAFLGVYGRVGKGPGEYTAPNAVLVSPFTPHLAVNDQGYARLILFDKVTFDPVLTRDLTAPVRATRIFPGPDSSLFVLGTSILPDPAHDAALLSHPDTVSALLLPRPRRFHQRLSSSLLFVTGDQTTRFVYAVRNLDSWTYRFTYDGDIVDSIRLPEEVYPGILPPQDLPGDGSVQALREWTKTQTWLAGVRAIHDELLVFEIGEFDASSQDWSRRYVALEWSDDPVVRVPEACSCKLLGDLGDTLAFLQGGPPEDFTVEWRLLSSR